MHRTYINFTYSTIQMLLSVPSEHEKVPLWTFLMCCWCTFFYTVLTWLIITGICWAVGHTATHMVHPSDPSLGLNGWGNGVALQRSNTSCVLAYKTIRLLKLLPLHNTCIFPSMHLEPVFLLYLFIYLFAPCEVAHFIELDISGLKEKRYDWCGILSLLSRAALENLLFYFCSIFCCFRTWPCFCCGTDKQ